MKSKISSLIELFALFAIIFSIVPTVNASSDGDVNIPFYLQTDAGIQRASYEDIQDLLINHKFSIEKKEMYIPDEKCTVRAEEGEFEMGEEINVKDEISFNIPLKNDGPGKGSFTAQYDRNRLSLKFEVTQILETNEQRLVFRASGTGNLNKQDLNFENIVVSYDKVNKKVSIQTDGDESFSSTGMDVTFVKWCGNSQSQIYLLTVENHNGTPRNTEQIQQLLLENPGLAQAYEGLRNLTNIPVVPEFGMVAGLVTILGAVGLFFFIRRK